jgi:hypothetical protein
LELIWPALFRLERTAGALDFLTEALEQWYEAKAAANPAVPLHDVSIDVFSGASTGGMCAAISAVMSGASYSRFVLAPSDSDNPKEDALQLSIGNPIIAAGLGKLDAATRAVVVEAFDPQGHGFMPIIPLCGTAVAEVPAPARATITSARVGHILNWIVDRLHAVTKSLVESTVGDGFDGWAARAAADTLISTWGKAKLREVLQNELKDVIAD